MVIMAVRILGSLHALPAVACLWSSIHISRSLTNTSISRARLRYLVTRMLLTSLTLAICVVTTWQQPSIAWVFAALSLAMYAPAPSFLARAAGPPTRDSAQILSYVPIVMAIRIVSAALLALATFWPGA